MTVIQDTLGLLSLVIQPFYTVDEIRSFRTMGLEPGEHRFPEDIVRFIIYWSTNKGITELLGFKDRDELVRFEDNITPPIQEGFQGAVFFFLVIVLIRLHPIQLLKKSLDR